MFLMCHMEVCEQDSGEGLARQKIICLKLSQTNFDMAQAFGGSTAAA